MCVIGVSQLRVEVQFELSGEQQRNRLIFVIGEMFLTILELGVITLFSSLGPPVKASKMFRSRIVTRRLVRNISFGSFKPKKTDPQFVVTLDKGYLPREVRNCISLIN